MRFDIDQTPVQWTDGSTGQIRQLSFRREMARGGSDAHVADLQIERTSTLTFEGTLRFTSEAHARLPGKGDGEKQNAVRAALKQWLAANDDLHDGFSLQVDVGEMGVCVSRF